MVFLWQRAFCYDNLKGNLYKQLKRDFKSVKYDKRLNMQADELGKGDLKVLVGLSHDMVVRDLPRHLEALYDGVLR